MKKQNTNRKISKKTVTLLEIFLVISIVVTTSYLIKESSEGLQLPRARQSKMALLLKVIGALLFSERGFVSALNTQDLQEGAYTCVKSKAGEYCQEFPASECSNKCDGECIPTTRDNVASCILGTCYDSVEGTCSTNSPQLLCTNNSGKWFDDPNANIPQCKKGCCILGENANFVTSQQCSKMSERYGLKADFKAEIATEFSCLVLSKSREEGACVFESEFENTCKYTTKAGCVGINGKFYSEYLCSNPELNTNCEKQKTTGCVTGKDEIYWFDSCGNRENIYDSDESKSYSNGRILSKTQSCSIGSTDNPLSNQKKCGNCNYILGSICGLKTDKEKLTDERQDVVCKDVRCDTNGDGTKDRDNGESWCEYQGAIGVDKGSGIDKDKKPLLRSIDTPGSRHFRQVCINGEVKTEPCADYRNEICVQADTKTTGSNTFSSAACRLNRWQQCLSYNTEIKNDNNLGGITPEQRDNKCTKNPDCVIKNVNVDKKGFNFNMCVPKYPEGFDLNTNSDAAQNICAFASQKCTEVWVKDMGGSWECMANCDCHTKKFSEQLNDLCISLGDCGTKANYEGELTYNSKIFKSNSAKKLGKDVTLTGKKWFSDSYINGLKAYADYKKGPNKFADPGNLSDFYGSLGIPEGFGVAAFADPSAALTGMSTMVGMGGMVLAMGVNAVVGAGAGTFAASIGTALPGLTAAGGALAGAAIGFAAVGMMIQFAGIGPAIGEEGAYALMAAGALAGGIIGGVAAFSGATVGATIGATIGAGVSSVGAGAAAGATAAATSSGAAAGTIGSSGAVVIGPMLAFAFWLIIAIVLFIIIEAILGAGEIKKVTYTFQCQPWQAPLGGAKCDQCGKDGLPCGKYNCNSLGQTCEFLNEGTGFESCVNVAPDDSTSPVIKPLEGILPEGYSYEENENGFKVKGPGDCIESFKPIFIGIELNEPGYCKVAEIHTNSFEDMEFDFGGSNLFLKNHTQLIDMPSLDSLGVSGYDPNRKADYNLYVRCQDKSGNINVKETVINFCVKPGNDLTPPIVVGRLPIYEYVKWDANSVNGTILVNEPADCRYDISDKSYELMTNSLNCAYSLNGVAVAGAVCDGKFDVKGNETKYYIRCKDQPWLVESSDEIVPSVIRTAIGEYENGTVVYREINASANKTRNTMQESYVFVIKKASSNLKIDYIKPDNVTLSGGVAPVTVNIEVGTSGGVDGKSTCRYAIRADSYLPLVGDTFVPPGVREHSVPLQLFDGEHLLYILCTDLAGNAADKATRFNIKIDTEPPRVSRVYESNGLVVVTDENSECSHSYDSCSFNFENGTLMTGNGLIHTSNFNKKANYYIKCKDQFGNVPGSCNIIVTGGVV